MKKQPELGGKANGLAWLAENTDLGFNVLKFKVIDTSYYEDFLKQPVLAQLAGLMYQKAHLDEKIVAVFQNCPKTLEKLGEELSRRFNGSDIVVRSSGVVSEDNKRFSGAGIYESFNIKAEDLNPQNLQEAVLKVYASVQKPKAATYRQDNGLKNERMAVVVQEFLEPDWSGVMYTSNPSYPKDLSIEFIRGRNRVVDGAKGSHIIDYNKKTKKKVFESEDLHGDLPFDADALARIGMALEKRIGASDIEFLVKDGQFYFIQRRKITDLQEPTRVRIPTYRQEQFIGTTKLKRGTGKVTLPVVKVADLGHMMNKLEALISIDPEETLKQVRDYFSGIMRKDEQFSSGYILLLPYFQQTVMPVYSLLTQGLGIKGKTSYDNLTPHKKAIITTNCASISSHVMTLAREKGIPYAGFENADELFEKVQTGDVLSVYFQGRNAKIFLEESPLRSIHETNPQVSFDIILIKESYVSVKTSTFLDSTRPYTNDFLLYLNTATGKEWRFKPFGEVMGGAFVNPEGRSILMSMAQIRGQYHEWSFDPPEICRHMGYKSLLKKQLLPLIEGYVDHLRSK